MKIAHLHIENFRGISSLQLDCSEGMNLFIGENGAGKSTVLEAARILLSWLVARIRNSKGRGFTLHNSDITKGASYCQLELALDDGTRWRLVKQKSTDRAKLEILTSLHEISSLADAIVKNYELNPDTCQLPVIANYGVNRAVTEMPKRLHKSHQLAPMDVYSSQLENVIKFRTFFEWYREREEMDNANFRFEDHYTEDKQLKAVREVVEIVMPGYRGLRVRHNPMSLVLEKEGREFNFEELSDGEKCYLSLVADIARQLAMANPGLANPLAGSGIVMIDEIDLHLHPKWQSDVLQKLRSAFRNCQFLVTTHSPFVVSNMKVFDGDAFFVMKLGQARMVTANTFGAKVDELLLEYFQLNGLRNEEIQQHIDAVWSMLATGGETTNSFQEQMDWLRSHLSPDDSEFVQINLEKAKNKSLK